MQSMKLCRGRAGGLPGISPMPCKCPAARSVWHPRTAPGRPMWWMPSAQPTAGPGGAHPGSRQTWSRRHPLHQKRRFLAKEWDCPDTFANPKKTGDMSTPQESVVKCLRYLTGFVAPSLLCKHIIRRSAVTRSWWWGRPPRGIGNSGYLLR